MITVNYTAVNTAGENHTHIYRPAGSGDYLFICFMSPMQVLTEDGIIATAPGACILYAPGQTHDFTAVHDFRISYFHFSVSEEDFAILNLPTNHVFYPRCINQIHSVMVRLQDEFFTREPLYTKAIDAYASEIMVMISREINEDLKNAPNDKNLYSLFCQARFTMLANCEKAWNSANMCEMVSLSRSQFYKYYDEFFGVSPMQDLKAARIEKAKTLLTNDELQVTEAAEMCGYSSIHHFSRAFKEHTGLSPMAYIKQVTGRIREIPED